MTCMAAPEQTCIVKVILEHEEAFNLRQHRRNETMLKKRILDFIHQLRQRGFRHFIISRVVGIFVALFLAFLPAFANVSDSPKLYYVIPTTWANITMFDIKGTSLYPSLLYAAISILVINLALCFTAVHLIKNRQVEIISH